MYVHQFEIKIYRGRLGAASAGCDLISSGFAVAKLRQGMCHNFLLESDKSVKSAVISGSGRAEDIPAVSVSASTAADAVSTGRPASTTVTRYSPHHAPSSPHVRIYKVWRPPAKSLSILYVSTIMLSNTIFLLKITHSCLTM